MSIPSDLILIFGEALVDAFDDEIKVGGEPFNVARHLAAFGFQPLMITRIGHDAFGEMILNECERFGLTTHGIQIDAQRPTGKVLVKMDAQGRVFDIPHEQAFDFIEADAALRSISTAGKSSYVYCGSLTQRHDVSSAAFTSVLRAAKAPAYVALNLRSDPESESHLGRMLSRADILKVNDTELEIVLSWYYGGTKIAISADSLDLHRDSIVNMMAAFEIGILVVTLGAGGAAAFRADGSCILKPPYKVINSIVDSVGAGDAFSSVMLAGRILDWPLATTLARANEFAAAICCIRGAVPEDLEFYDSWAEYWSLASP